ncbi:MAG: VWA domain-containing protein [Clostridia bacterium]|nr:VWA domain-containing protein [Clostridia bacterium]
MKKALSIILSVVLACSCMTICAHAVYFKELDLVFVIDSTSSMLDNIERVQEDMTMYIDALEQSRKDYRIAIVDYRDFAERSESEKDYPYKVTLDFTEIVGDILDGVRLLDLGYGGDGPETICSALIDGLNALSWRENSAKAAILIGDAPALDPEPNTGYTKKDVVNYLRYGSGNILDILMGKSTRSHIQLFSIATISDYIRDYDDYEEMVDLIIDDFAYLADGTGGKSFIADDTWEITESVLKIIDNLEEWVVDPDESITPAYGKKFEGVLGPVSAIVLAPYAFLYMVISKLIDSSSAGFNSFLAFLERLLVR